MSSLRLEPRQDYIATSSAILITIHANSDNPVCYVMRLDEVRALAGQDKNGGAWWLEPKSYDKDEFRDAWHRLLPEVVEAEEQQAEREGIRRPQAEADCRGCSIATAAKQESRLSRRSIAAWVANKLTGAWWRLAYAKTCGNCR